MADTETTPTPGKLTEEAFLQDRMNFWSWLTGMTMKTTVALIVFCAWLWWCGVGGFTILHVLTLPVALGAVVYFL
jgi:hypothetical protein